MKSVHLTGQERFLKPDEIIVSKTDLKGRIRYANRIFMEIGGFEEKELIGQPHNILRHPDMPRAVFKLLWERIQQGQEIFAYVVNRAKNGDHYWVFAHLTPNFDSSNQIVGYHSSRRRPDKRALEEVIIPLYRTLRAEEEKNANAKEGMNKSYELLQEILKSKGMSYDEFIFSL